MKTVFHSYGRKKIMLITAALLLTVLTAATAYLILRLALPSYDASAPVETVPLPSAKETLTTKANGLRKAGEAALAADDPKTALKAFTTAKQLYKEAGDPQRVEEMNDLLQQANSQAAATKEKTPIPQATAP